MVEAEGAAPWSFAALVAPIDPNEFLRDYYDQKPVHLQGEADRFRDLLSWDKLNEILAIGGLWTADSLDVALEGQPIAPQSYANPGMGWDGRQALVPDVKKLSQLLRKGATIAVEKLHGMAPELRALSGSMASVLGAPITSNAFCSWDGTRGYGVHFDTLQVFAVQVEGEKTWEIFEGRIPNAAEFAGFRANEIGFDERERQKGKLLMQVTLKPGDMLYVPQGQYHRALASDKSLHLSLGARHYTGVDLINLMVPHLAQVSDFRKRLPHFDDEAAHQAHTKMLAETLARVLQDPTVSPTMRRFQRDKAFERQQAFTLPDRQPVTEFRVLWQRYAVKPGPDDSLIMRPKAGKKQDIAVPSDLHDLVVWVLRHDRFFLGDATTAFAGHAPAALQQKLKALVDLGLIETI